MTSFVVPKFAITIKQLVARSPSSRSSPWIMGLRCCSANLVHRRFISFTSSTMQQERPGGPITMAYNSYEATSTPESNANPVVIMHGLFGSKQNWRTICKELHAKSIPCRKIVAVDARNHGESGHSPNHSYEDLADDIVEFYRQHDIKQAIVMGHSMGGRAMMVFALKYPELVEAAIFVDISPVKTSPSLHSMADLFEAMRKVNVPRELNINAGRRFADDQMMVSVKDYRTRQFILMNLIKLPNGAFGWRANVEALHVNFKNHIAVFPEHLRHEQYMGRVLFIAGSESDYLNYTQLPEIKEIFPNTRLDVLHAGHLVHVERPHEFVRSATKFINREYEIVKC